MRANIFVQLFILEKCIEDLLTKIMRDNYMGKLYSLCPSGVYRLLTVRNATEKPYCKVDKEEIV